MQIIGKIHEGHCANEVFLGTLDFGYWQVYFVL